MTREAYRDSVEAYSQILKQQKLKTMASTEGRKIAFTGVFAANKSGRRRNAEFERTRCVERTGRTIPQQYVSRHGCDSTASVHRWRTESTK